jgi:membrane protein YdbS with pleckstrin-like domain
VTRVAEASAATVYRSKTDWWLGAILGVAILALIASAGSLWLAAGPPAVRVGIAAFFLGTAALVLWIFRGTRYELHPDRLVVRSGPFRWTVPLAAIQEVRPTRNPLSSPALSLDRLEIRYRGSNLGIMIAPEPRAPFLQQLAARAPHLDLREDRLLER